MSISSFRATETGFAPSPVVVFTNEIISPALISLPEFFRSEPP